MTTRTVEPIASSAARNGARPQGGRGRAAEQARRRSARLEQGFLWMLALGQRGLVVVLAIAVLIAFAAGIFEQRWKEGQLRDQVAMQQASLQAAEARNAELREQLAENDPAAYRAWVEATARRQLNLGYAGETVFLVNWQSAPSSASAANSTPATTTTTGKQPTALPASPAEAHWRKWLRLLFDGK